MKPVVRALGVPVPRSLLVGCLSVLLLAAMPPGPAHRVKDINETPESPPGSAGAAIVAGNTLYFTVSNMLWKSDGTTAGTQPVDGTGAIAGAHLQAVFGDILYFTTTDGGHGIELWRTDGTLEGTRIVRDINPGRGNSDIRSPVAFRGEMYFGANDGVHGFELWKTDGTEDGTVLAADLNPGPKGSALFSLRASRDRLYFAESSFAPDSLATLHSTDGTASGTRPLRQFVAASTGCYFEGCFGWPPGDFISLGGLTYFIASDGISGLELWRTDGTTLGTTPVKDICPGACNAFAYSDGLSALDAPQLQVLGGRLVFFANDGVHGREPWTSDGTEAGTRLVKDVFPGAFDSSYGYGATAVGSVLLFPAHDSPNGWELWRSDGTEAGTFLVGPESGDSAPNQITPVGDVAFFSAAFIEPRSTGPGIRRLWKTDSAVTRASVVSDSVSDPTRLVNFGGTLYFTAPGPAGFSLWKTDGSSAGTDVVRVLSRENSSSNSQFLGEFDGSLLFFANNGNDFSGLWRTDGTDAGTQPIAPVFGDGFLGPSSGLFAPFGGSLFFNGDDGIHGSELWRTDATVGGTRLVKDIAVPGGVVYPYIQGSFPCALTAVGGTLYFGATDGDHGAGLWKTDGTEAGTEFIKDVGLDCSSGLPAFNGGLYFSGTTFSPFESGLWRTDGTSQGTELIRPVTVRGLTSVNGTLVFAGSDDAGENGLWTSDGTAAGTLLVQPFSGGVGSFVLSRDGAFFRAWTADYRSQLWRTDGTRNGTTLLTEFPYGQVNEIGLVNEIVTIGNRAFFAGEDAEHGVELWTSDGTPAGTHRVKDIAPGAADANPRNLSAIAGVLLFSARDPIHGEELWRSDGTEEGTFLLQDISPGVSSSSPGGFTKAGSLVYFTADDGETGVELWAMPVSVLDSAPGRKPRPVQDVPWRR